MEKIRWGILSTGSIAATFVRGLRELPEAVIVAVGSRTATSAEAFGARFDIPHRHASYEALAADPDVDVIYVGTPHNLHAANTMLCLEAGKAVLCEKPFAINAVEARAMVGLARERGLFLMEAMWTRFRPHMVALRRAIADGTIGEVRMLRAELCFRASFDPEQRLFNPALGGGALLDVGVYPIALAHMVFGAPERISSLATIGASGVDEQMTAVLGYAGGQLAICSAATRTATPASALLAGTEGWIEISSPWLPPAALTLRRRDGAADSLPFTEVGNGYQYQAAEVHACLRAGRIESETMPHTESIAIMTTMDSIRDQWGLRYPME
jgi:predicted dehydrogenase